MEIKISEKLTCPFCSIKNKTDYPLLREPAQHAGLRCSNCKRVYSTDDGIIDFVGGASRDISMSQRVMEFSPVVAVYERFWRPMVTRPFSNLHWEMQTATRLLNLAPQQDLLDIACGTGNFTRLFLNSIHNGTVTGIDLSLSMLKNGARMLGLNQHNNLALMRVDVTQWPFAAHSFDRIHCAGALHLFPEIQAVFYSIARSLKPGGLFVGATYVEGTGLIKSTIQKWVSFRSGFHWFTRDELFELTRNAGFIEWEQHINKQGILFRVKKPD